MAQFLFSLVLPPSCKLRLNIWDEDVAIAPGFPLICAWLSRHFQPPPSSHEGEDSFQNYFRSVLVEDNMGDFGCGLICGIFAKPLTLKFFIVSQRSSIKHSRVWTKRGVFLVLMALSKVA